MKDAIPSRLGAFIHRFRKPLIWLGGILTALVLFAFFGLPPLVKAIVTKRLSATLHREVTIQKININPFVLSLTVTGFQVKDRDIQATLVSFDELFLNFESFSALRLALILKEIRISKPFIRIVRHQDNSYNFSDLLANDKKKESGTASPVRFSFNNIRIINGSIDFLDEPKQKKHTVRNANISVPFISTIPTYIETFVEPAFSATINETRYSLRGRTKLFAASHETSFDINIADLDIPYYLAYLPLNTDLQIISAFLEAKTQISFIEYTNGERALTLKGDLAFKQVSVNDAQDEPVLKLPRLDISLASTEPLKKLFHLAVVSCRSPELHIRRDRTGALNIGSLLPRKQEAQAGAGGDGNAAPLLLDVDGIEMVSGTISYSDLSRANPFRTTLYPVELKVSHFSNGRDRQSHFALRITSEAHENINLEGDLSVDPLAVQGKADIRSIPIRKYSPYYADLFLFDVENGLLDLSSDYAYTGTPTGARVILSELSGFVKSLRLKKRDEHEDFLDIPSIRVRQTRLDQARRELLIGEVVTEKGSIVVKRLKDANLNLQTLLAPSGNPEAQTVRTKPTQVEQPWVVSIGKFLANKYVVAAEDQMPAEPVNLRAQDVNLKAEGISTKEGQKGRVSLSLHLGEKGSLLAEGPIGLHPLFARLAVNLKDIDIRPAQPYFTDRVRITVTNGSASASGNLSVTDQKGIGLGVSYKGDASLSKFSSIDMAHAEEFLIWESLYLGDLDVGYNPTFFHPNTIALTDFYGRVIIHTDGSLNLQQVIGTKPAEPTSSPATRAQPPDTPTAVPGKAASDIWVRKVTLQGGRINFSDESVEPNYSSNLVEIGGRISGLSSEETSLADVELRGKLDRYAPLEIIGKINPLRKDLFVDLKARFTDMDLSSVTPYSGKYIGYTIQKGKLSFDLSYQIVRRKLDSQNSVFLDQMTLGDRVERPGATNLPVRLAIALLKDRNGEIKLDIPVTGSLDDPKFSVWKIILQVIVNLIAKAATSPFALLGAAFGGGEELSSLEFDYGSVAIGEANLKKLDTLVKALYERPSLKLEIEGHVDLEKDKEGLKQSLFNRKLKAQKLNERIKQGLPAIHVDDVKVEPNEYEKYLTLAYKAEKFPKPRNFLGFAKSLPVPEMEKLMLTNTEIKDNDLRTLASQRAMGVKDMILKSGKIEPARVFIIEPKSLSPERQEKTRDSRVEFKIS